MGNSKFARGTLLGGAVALVLGAGASAQSLQAIDPNQAINSDLGPVRQAAAAQPAAQATSGADYATPVGSEAGTIPALPAQSPPTQPATPAVPSQGATYHKDDVIGAAEGVFGKGAEGLARLIADVLKKQGEPNGYIVGREAGGAFIVGLRYGSGTLYHKVEGEKPVYWTGPSIGFDAGANAGKTFVLVYNLYDSQDLYKRFPAGEGQAYVIGGFNASYMRQGDVVLIPVRMGVGLRLGVNAGYMKFSKTQKWLPF